MILTIFRAETNSSEEWLICNADGMFTYHIENSGWSMAGSNPLPRDVRMTPQEAKLRWPTFADKIDAALIQIATET